MAHTDEIKAIIGLGNPGPRYQHDRHNIGFMVVDELADRFHADWQKKDNLSYAHIRVADHPVFLIKPQTFMNDSGKVISWLQKKGIGAQNFLVVHDELEKPFGHLSIKFGGSARGHNGLRSIINVVGKDFHRLRFGIGRPERKEDVGDWVLQPFDVPQAERDILIVKAADMIEELLKESGTQRD